MSAADLLARALQGFDALVDLEPEARAARLESIHEQDPALAKAIEQLLAADADHSGVLDRNFAEQEPTMVGELAGAAADGESTGQRSQQFGGFRLLRLIGSGGMGEVWLAEREHEGFTQQVALKLLKRGMEQLESVRRFLLERQILATLSHPAIARFIDGGVGLDGQPWYAMDYVEGQPITEYARTKRLSLRDRVRLMLSVCEAVAYAQSRLVVHRDLKPSNILVDDQGQAHLLDFGIAKLLQAETDGAITATGMCALSPAYAAPEQILDQPISTATDVYALGLLLFELLTGRLPHRRSSRSLAGLAAELTQERTERPSTLLRRIEADALAGIDRDRFLRELSRDLEAIVMTALRPEPEQRFGSAAALAEDLRRWLDGHPVHAAGDSVAYRSSKFLRRHRVGVGAAALVLLALFVGLGSALWQANVARAQAQRAELVKEFMLSLFQESDPVARAQAQARPPLELVVQGIERAQVQLRADPRLRLDVLADLGRLAGALGDPKLAAQVLQQVLDDFNALEPRMSADAAEVAAELASMRTQLGDTDGGRILAEQALQVLRERRGPESLDTAQAMSHLARALLLQGELQRALDLSRDVHEIHKAQLGAEDPEPLARLYAVAVVLEQMDRTSDADALLVEVIAGIEHSLGPDHARLVRPLAVRADLARREERQTEARALFERAIAIARARLGDGHPMLGAQLMRYGDLLRRMGDPTAAMATLDEAAACFPAGSTEAAQIAMFRGQLLRGLGQNQAALAAFQQAQQRFSQSLGPGSVFPWAAAMQAADTMLDLGLLEQAEPILVEVLENQQRIAGADSYDVALGSTSLGRLRRAQGRHDEALALHGRALEILSGLYGADNANAAHARLELAQSLRSSGRLDEAKAQIERLLANLPQIDSTRATQIHLEAARLARAQGDHPQQQLQAKRAMALLRPEQAQLRAEIEPLLAGDSQ